MSGTALEAIVQHLEGAARFNPAVEAPPVALLWCDPAGECAPLMPALRSRLPQLLTLGNADLAARSGPAFWLRAAVDRALPDVAWPEGPTPVIWLPGVARETLRGAEDCPPNLALLVWFAVAGQFYGHKNGKDWSLRALVSSNSGPLGLDIAEDGLTRQALSRAVPRLLSKSLVELRGRRWDADALDGLLVDDFDADMLDWIGGTLAPDGDPERFAAFCDKASREFGFDPRKASPEQAARLLAERGGNWDRLWRRFETSAGYDGVVERMRVLEPPTDFLLDRSTYPRANEADEDEVRRSLAGLQSLDLSAARVRVLELEQKHGARRNGAWARRGLAPLARSLEHLAVIATAEPLADHSPDALAHAYADAGWRVDQAALAAYAAAPRPVDREAVQLALRALYLPWLEAASSALQTLARSGDVPFARPAAYHGPETLMFVDGLRFDLASALMDKLQAQGAEASIRWVWSGFPTVTATCKPLVSPVAGSVAAGACGPSFSPVTAEGRPLNKPLFDKLLAEEGWSVGFDLGSQGRVWVETGRFDTDGHSFGDRLADQLQAAVDELAEEVLTLARAGRSLRIVTDHGWLWLPGGLPKAALSAGLAEDDGKRTRCALLKDGAETAFARVPWSWDDHVRIAAATGAHSFFKSYSYAHGGVSPQECVLPVIEVAPLASATRARIASAEWTGLRLRVVVEGGADLSVDLRDEAGGSMLTAVRGIDEEGRASFPVSSDDEDKPALLVVLDDDGRVLVERRMIVGRNQ